MVEGLGFWGSLTSVLQAVTGETPLWGFRREGWRFKDSCERRMLQGSLKNFNQNPMYPDVAT